MTDFSQSLNTLTSIEELVDGQTIIHRLHPGVKLALTFLYLVLVVSCPVYNPGLLAVFAFFPFILMALAEIPWRPLFKRVAIALPFVAFAGIANLIFDRQVVAVIGFLPITTGGLSFLTILLKTCFCVTAVLILIATTGLPAIAYQLLRIHIPRILVEQILLIYRYISVLLGEAARMTTAYHLRAPQERGIRMKDMGVFLGQLLLRSFDRADRVYHAMKCRGYDGSFLQGRPAPANAVDYAVFFLGAGALLLMRFFPFLWTQVFLPLF